MCAHTHTNLYLSCSSSWKGIPFKLKFQGVLSEIRQLRLKFRFPYTIHPSSGQPESSFYLFPPRNIQLKGSSSGPFRDEGFPSQRFPPWMNSPREDAVGSIPLLKICLICSPFYRPEGRELDRYFEALWLRWKSWVGSFEAQRENWSSIGTKENWIYLFVILVARRDLKLRIMIPSANSGSHLVRV